MADEKHPNDDYLNPASRTAAAPIPPESPHDGTGEKRAEDPEAGQDQAKSDAANADAPARQAQSQNQAKKS